MWCFEALFNWTLFTQNPEAISQYFIFTGIHFPNYQIRIKIEERGTTNKMETKKLQEYKLYQVFKFWPYFYQLIIFTHPIPLFNDYFFENKFSRLPLTQKLHPMGQLFGRVLRAQTLWRPRGVHAHFPAKNRIFFQKRIKIMISHHHIIWNNWYFEGNFGP